MIQSSILIKNRSTVRYIWSSGSGWRKVVLGVKGSQQAHSMFEHLVQPQQSIEAKDKHHLRLKINLCISPGYKRKIHIVANNFSDILENRVCELDLVMFCNRSYKRWNVWENVFMNMSEFCIKEVKIVWIFVGEDSSAMQLHKWIRKHFESCSK